ncbi:STAS-like domain-containing protein [Terribacillus halophilus]|uniref:STAS-like domain-containing protein n=1 Tax=Terribacillus halophilus TaxID=361279 RepID=UPI00398246C3
MGFLRILDHVERCYSNEDGIVIFNKLSEQLKKGEKVTLSFMHVDTVTSSFVNSALIELLEQYSFDYIKRNIKFVDTNSLINDMIKRRFSFEVNERKKLIYS